jgi:hypothetical protein
MAELVSPGVYEMPNDLVERARTAPLRAAEHAIHFEDGAATMIAGSLERIVS